MISFDCPSCDKPLIVQNKLGGTIISCPGCGSDLQVPEPSTSSRWGVRRKLGIGFAVVIVLVAVVGGFWAAHVRRPAIIQERLQSALQEFSPSWAGTDWQACDPNQDEYRLVAYHTAEAGSYTFEVTRLAGTEQTIIRVNPQAHPPKFLAYALFHRDEQQVYDYHGLHPGEKDLLRDLTADLNAALCHAVR